MSENNNDIQDKVSSSVEDNVITIEVNEVLDLKEDALKCIELKQVPYSYSGSSYQGGNPSYNGGYNVYRNTYNEPKDDRTIYFYEFSDTSRQPKLFTKVSEFLKWAKECDIMVSDYIENQLRTHTCNYCACYKSSKYIAREDEYLVLKNRINPDYSYRGSGNSYNSHQYGSYPRYYDPYDEYWD